MTTTQRERSERAEAVRDWAEATFGAAHDLVIGFDRLAYIVTEYRREAERLAARGDVESGREAKSLRLRATSMELTTIQIGEYLRQRHPAEVAS